MKVLVTGGAGFIGANFVHYLSEVRPNWDVTVLDLLTYAGNLESIAPLIDRKTIRFVRLDIAEQAVLDAFLKEARFDVVFHFAAESHVDRSIHSAAEFVRTNIAGTQNLLSACRAFGVGRFVHVSTDEVYGSLGPTGRFTESTPLDPTSPYAASKAASDLLVLACYKTHDFDALVTRCTNNYGPYQFPEKLIPLFVTNALQDKKLPLYGDGMNVRSWLFVRDHCEALLLVAEKGKKGEIYNIGGAEESELPNRQVTRMILDILKKSENLIEVVKDRPAHDRRYAIDYSKIQRELGWSPKTNFHLGLEHTVRWYIENRSWWEKVKTGEYLRFYETNYGSR